MSATTVLLTAAAVVAALGLVLLILGIAGRRPEAAGADVADDRGGLDYAPARPARRPRIVPLVVGLMLTLAGTAGLFLILREGIDSPRIDAWVTTKWPAGPLVADLDEGDSSTRNTAKIELTRRYELGELPDDVERQLAQRKIRSILGDPKEDSTPKVGIVDVNLGKARRDGLIDDAAWGEYVARNYPKSLSVPDRVGAGEPLVVRMTPGLEDAEAPAWMLLVLDEIKFADAPHAGALAVIVARNPAWSPPPPPTPTTNPTAAVGAGGGRPPARTRVRIEEPVPASLIEAAGLGQHEFSARLRAFAFDPTKTPPPADLMAAAAQAAAGGQQGGQGPTTRPGEGQMPAVVYARVTAEQVGALSGQALGKWEWPIRRQVRVGDAPAPAAGQGEGGGDESDGEE